MIGWYIASLTKAAQGFSQLSKHGPALHLGKGGVILYRDNSFQGTLQFQRNFFKFHEKFAIFTEKFQILKRFSKFRRTFQRNFSITYLALKNSLFSLKGSGIVWAHLPRQEKFSNCMRKINGTNQFVDKFLMTNRFFNFTSQFNQKFFIFRE